MNRKALVVGINTYTHLRSLNAPAADANAIAARLEEDGEFRVIRLPEAITQENSGERIPQVGSTLLVIQAQLEQELKQLFRPDSTQYPETALFYFSGHGIPDSEGYDKGYLATSDTDPNHPRLAISLRWLHWLLSESPIKQQIVWLDCCHSGGLLINVESANPGHENSRHRCFIASSRDYESSWQDLNSPYSVLTKALLDGLEPNRLAGRWIDSFALVDYVNQALRGELQSPVCTNFGDAINLTRSWRVEDKTSSEATQDADICPYKGLEFFDFNDEDPKYFFGREELTGELLDKVRTSNFMALVGASGNGKSSVLRAGLLHQTKVGRRIADSDQWQIRITRPDKTPLRNLALAFVDAEATGVDRAEQLGKAERLIELGADGLRRLVQTEIAPRVILVIDQFEEMFTRCEDLEEREQFFACLMGALAETDNKLCLIIAMRTDFVGKCLERNYSGLAQQVQQHMISVLPMNPDELKAAICKPAEQVSLQVEEALVTEILNDIKGSPGYLPLLQYTLKELWQQRQENQLVFSAYQKLGGIDGTLDKRATAIYNSFDPAEQRTVQHIFQQLTQLGEGTEDTRRRVFLDNLIAEPQHPAERINQVIATLAASENRLLVTSEVVSKGNDAERMAIVDVAHEALIRHWQLLRQWIERDRDLLRQQRRIEASAVAWQEQGRSKGYLLQGLPLIEAKQFQQKQAEQFPLSDPAKMFIQKGVWQRQWHALKTASWLIIPAMLILGVVEHNLREDSIKADYARLDGESAYEEKQAVTDLVEGCRQSRVFGWMPNYFIERLFGNCRSLFNAPLAEANLSSANIRYADLSSAVLSDADLSSAVLSDAVLSSADLSSANIRYADLSSAVLSDAVLSSADLSSADLSSAVLSDAVLSSADLSSAVLSSADLSSAVLSSANLSSADLSSADLSSAVLSSANIRYVNLSSAFLSFADLSDADLSSANIRYAFLSFANIRYANLSSADFSSADLSSADLSNANIRYADLSFANIRYANLSSADLSFADLSLADLSNANIRYANLSSANLSSAVLSSANIRSANIRSANLSFANTRYANLSSADLSDADLSDADLSDADLSNADLSNANIRYANLSSADLSDAVLVATDLRESENLTVEQLTGEGQPYLCGVAFPLNITGIGSNRDCDALPSILVDRYGEFDMTLEEAQQLIEDARNKQWDGL